MKRLAFVILALALVRCTDNTGPLAPPPPPPPPPPPVAVILSGLVPPSGSGAAGGSAATSSARLVYVSLSPGAAPSGATATITNRATSDVVTTALVDGGFDPVPISASVGDTIAVDITGAPPTVPVHVLVVASARRPPRIVRTRPPPGGRDVPLNSTIVVVFSEPVDPATLDTVSLQLFNNGARVPGTVRLNAGSDLIAELQPASLLAAQTTYSFTVSTQIRGIGGLGVTASSPVSFTTGTASQAPVATKLGFTVQPTNATARDLLDSVSVAIQDSLGNTITSANDVVTLRNACVAGSSCESNSATNYSLTGGVSVQAVNGVATFSTLRLAIAAKGYTLIATSGTLAPDTSTAFDVAPGAPAQLRFTSLYNVTVGQPFTVDVAIADLSSNTVTRASGTVVTLSIVSGPPGATLTGSLDNDTAIAGVVHFDQVFVDKPGPYTLAATSNGLASASGSMVAYDQGAFVAVSTGANHTCGLSYVGAAYCWGLNDHGQLGDGTTTDRNAPVGVVGGLTFRAIVTGDNHSCALTETGGLWYCWGANSAGQLGDGTTSDQSKPVQMAGSLHFDALSAGASHTCGAVSRPDGEMLFYCWGLNDHGQLGDGTTNPRSGPTLVANLGPVYGPVVAGGNHTCAQNYDTGESFCWGANDHGQLDDGSTIDRATPFAFWGVPCGAGPPGFAPPSSCPTGAVTPFNMGITAGGAHTCAGAGGAYAMSLAWYCWGANGSGQLGDGSTTDRTRFVLADNGRAFRLVSAGGSHTCGIAGGLPYAQIPTGPVYCWGANDHGQLGDGTTTQQTSGVPVAGGLTFLAISAGGSHTCGVTPSGVYCWGSNANGQLGDGSTTDRSVPVKVAGQ